MDEFFYLWKCSVIRASQPTSHIRQDNRCLWSLRPVLKCVTIAKIFFQGTSQNRSVYRHGIIKRPEEYLSPYKRFVRSPPKSFFKKLFLGDSQLGYKFQKMTKRNGVLKGLKDQECKHGNQTNRPPIPYVPVVDEIQDAVNANSNEPRTQKIKLLNKTKFQAGVWNTGMPKEFLIHVKQAIHACDRMGLFSDYGTYMMLQRKTSRLPKQLVSTSQSSMTSSR